jgi:DNA-directed RNA polymerase subunit RPC12/RpoP
LQIDPAVITPTAPDQGKAGKADRRYLSNFWEAERGEGGRLDIIDYICPKCHKNIYYQLWAATYCPHCNTPIFSAPRRKLDAKQFTNWRGNIIENMQYKGPEKKRKRS